MSRYAYITELSRNEREILDGEFLGEDETIKADIEVRGALCRGINLRGCFRANIRATDELLKSAPHTLIVNNRTKNLPDFGYAPWGGLGLMSERAADIIQSLDGGRNQFIQIKNTVNRRGEPIDKKYYIMLVCTVISAVNAEASNAKIVEHHWPPRHGLPASIMTIMKFPNINDVVLNASVIGDAHVWIGTPGELLRTFFSDTVVNKLNDSGVSKLKYTRVNVI